jgi:aminoglycoside/choline kinase family phosphotransferase
LSKTKILQDIFERYAGHQPKKFEKLPGSGSYREYYRMHAKGKSAIGVFNADRKENDAFLSFTRHFLEKGLSVPRIYQEDLENNIYLLEDLGDITLFSFLMENRENGEFPEKAIPFYKKIVEELPLFQIYGNEGLDYSKCYPRSKFDKQSMMWDLNYFKYYFLKLAKISFDEQELENDFQKFSDWLLTENSDFFLYRDFQSSNIMIRDHQTYYIDYQGGRKGALQYDLASLLWDAKADIPFELRNYLLEHYLEHAQKHLPVNTARFKNYYYGFVLIRLLQAMGAFGFRGFYENKPSFLKSIPYALKNLTFLLNQYILPLDIPHLVHVLKSLPNAPELKHFTNTREYKGRLMVEINSFSYRRGIPVDLSEHGGGFVFDCRAIHNPGRYEEFKDKNGHDPQVMEFLRTQSEADEFVADAFKLIHKSVDNYLDRKFTNLMINFGCTGGQHRSIYCAEKMKEILQQRYGQDIEILIHHREEEMKKLGL